MIVTVLTLPLIITVEGRLAFASFRRRPCQLWNAIGDLLVQEPIAFRPMGQTLDPNMFVVLAYSAVSFVFWQVVQSNTKFKV